MHSVTNLGFEKISTTELRERICKD